jgi:hypothetical protein
MEMGKSSGAAVAALLVMSTAAIAAPPTVDGRYAFLSQTFCEAKLIVSKAGPNVTNVTLSQSGQMYSGVGYITFNSGAGTASITSQKGIEGGTLRVNNTGFAWGPAKDPNQTNIPYSFTNSTFTFGGQDYVMVYADGEGGGAYRSVYLVRRGQGNSETNANCVESIWATKQPQ